MSNKAALDGSLSDSRPAIAFALPADRLSRLFLLFVAGLSAGESRIEGLPDDPLLDEAARLLSAFGIGMRRLGTVWLVNGVGNGALLAPQDLCEAAAHPELAALLLGLAGLYDVPLALRCAPPEMQPLLEPLARMGMQVEAREADLLRVRGPRLAGPLRQDLPGGPQGLEGGAWLMPALMLAALAACGDTFLRNPEDGAAQVFSSILRLFGGRVAEVTGEAGRDVRITGRVPLFAQRIDLGGVQAPQVAATGA